MIKFRLMAALLLGGALAVSVAPVDAARDRKEKETATVSKTGRTDKPAKSSEKFAKAYAKVAKQYDAEQYDEALAALEKLDTPKTTPYEKAKIAQLRGYVYYNQDQIPQAIEQFKAALATDALVNNEHFALKLTMAELYHMNDQLPESAATFDDWLKDAETIAGRNWALQAKNYYDQDDYEKALDFISKAYATGDKPERAWAQMKANSLLSLERTDEAIAFGRQVLAEAPDDAEFVNFLTVLLLGADKAQDAVTMLEGMRAKGQLTQENLYLNLYTGYRDLEKPKEAAEAMAEGIDKGIIPKSRDRFLQIGEAYYDAEVLSQALENFRKAADLSTNDGTADLYAGQVLLDQENPKEARVAFAAAIQKGNLKQLGNAYYQLGIAELDSDNEAAAIAAFKTAQGYPESAKNATQALKSLGR